MQQCEDCIDHAVLLLIGLADEQEGWTESARTCKVAIFNLIGNILISALKSYVFRLVFERKSTFLRNICFYII
jgi:hypothetical protein